MHSYKMWDARLSNTTNMKDLGIVGNHKLKMSQYEPDKEIKKTTTRNQAFSAVAPTLWIVKPPLEIKQDPSLQSFRKLLKTKLFRKAFGNI